jgi:threonine dehydrogenase-like Zn-dependent dehydrogenase
VISPTNGCSFLTDILPTGYAGIDWAEPKGAEVAVFGCGPVGLMTQKVAWLKGASRVIGIDIQPYRLETGQIFDKGIKMRFGQSTPQRDIDELIGWVEQGKIKLDDIITHRLPLAEAPHGYDIFNKKEDNCVKVVLKP